MTEAQLKMVRMVCFFGILLVMGGLELLAPRRQLSLSKPRRWLTNIGIVFVDTAFVRFLVPVTTVSIALFAEQNKIGVFHTFMAVPEWASVVLAIIMLDFIIYLQHVMFHAVPLLWRLHMVHHADMDIDVTTGLRFHPIEILISAGIKFAAVLLLGAPAQAVFLFEVILNGSAMFNHSNVKLPLGLDRVLRFIIVTPDMHRVHHSVFRNETNSNFGFNLPHWDRIFGTYTAQPRAGHEKMKIGLTQFRTSKVASMVWLLGAPFYERTGHYAINSQTEE